MILLIKHYDYMAKQGVNKMNKVKRSAKVGETIEIIKTGEIKKVRFTFIGGVHANDFYLTSFLDDEYLVLE
jgi:hypothetical protein